MAWGLNPSGNPVAVADRSGEVLLLLDEDGRLKHAVKVNSADHRHDRITLLHAGKDSIYANVITTDGQHIVREQIRVYNRRGRCVRTVFDESYTEKTIFSPRNQLFFSDRDGLSVVRIENNDLKTISLSSSRPEMTDSLHLD